MCFISSISDSEAELREAFSRETKMSEVRATTSTRTLGVLFPNKSQEGKEVGGTWIPVIQKERTSLLVESFLSM